MTALHFANRSVSKERLGNYMASCTKNEMSEIDRAIAVALDLNPKNEEAPKETAGTDENNIAMRAERDVYKQLYEKLIASLLK